MNRERDEFIRSPEAMEIAARAANRQAREAREATRQRDTQLREFFDQRELELRAEHLIAQRMPHLQRYRGDTLTPWAALQALREFYAEERSR